MKQTLPCAAVRDLLPLYADRLTEAETTEAVKAHLEGCPACNALYREMTAPEPAETAEAAREVDYLKKLKRRGTRIKLGALAAVLVAALGLSLFFRSKNAAPKVHYEPESKTLVVTGTGDYAGLTLPEEVDRALNLDLQDDSFRMALYLPMLRDQGQSLGDYLPGYLDRTDKSLQFLRDYLKEHAQGSYPGERAEKYLDMTVRAAGDYSFQEEETRILLEMGRFYWHREELYLLSLMGSQSVEWQQLGYAWYVGTCLDPYTELQVSADDLAGEVYYPAFQKAGGAAVSEPGARYRMLYDAVSWYCLNHGMRWGTAYESYPLKDTALFTGSAQDRSPGNSMSVIMAASMIGWLSDQYGFDAVTAYCFGQKTLEEAFGREFSTLKADWSAWLKENYTP